MFVNLLDLTSERESRDALAAAREELWHLANHDALTGLANRYRLADRLAAAVRGGGDVGDGTDRARTRPAELDELADRLVDCFGELFVANGLSFDIGISVGGAMAEPGDVDDPDALILRADRTMYAAEAAAHADPGHQVARGVAAGQGGVGDGRV